MIAVILNLLLAGLLTAALVMGWGLNKKLKGLRDSHADFARAVADLDAAALRAERGLADLRSATDEAAEHLGAQMDRARLLVSKLDERLARPVPTAGSTRLQALAQTLDRVAPETAPAATPVDAMERRVARFAEELSRARPVVADGARTRPAAVDDDLFEGVTLQALVGGRR
jgi:Domain of unknown function (DUF6468)